MRFLSVLSFLALLVPATAQSGPRVQFSHTSESLRGVSAVLHSVAWASGTHGTYLRTVDGGVTWVAAQVPDATALDFRGVVAFSADSAFLMSSGPGDQSKIYYTGDGGKSWQLQFTNANPKGFFDSIAFWDDKHGIVVGDPVADDAGKLKFAILTTDDGTNWKVMPGAGMPEAQEGEGAFAASNTCLALAAGGDDVWFATGGKVARVFHSADRGKSWQVFDAPVWHGKDSQGIFSIAFRDAMHGMIAGGDYKHPNDDGPNLAFTDDGGKTWKVSEVRPQAYFSAVAYDQRVNADAIAARQAEAAKRARVKPVDPQRIFVVGQDFVFDFRPPGNPRRLSGKGMKFNAVSAFPEGGALIVGPKGSIALLP